MRTVFDKAEPETDLLYFLFLFSFVLLKSQLVLFTEIYDLSILCFFLTVWHKKCQVSTCLLI